MPHAPSAGNTHDTHTLLVDTAALPVVPAPEEPVSYGGAQAYRQAPHGVPRAHRREGETSRLLGLPPAVRTAVRRVVVLAMLLPVLLVLARETPRLVASPLVAGYGVAVLTVTLIILYIAYVRYEDPSWFALRRRPRNVSDFPNLPECPRVSLLVAVKDEQDGIEACVRSMAASHYWPVQIIVVNDASTDDTAEVLDRLAAELDIRVLHLERNVGKKHALVRGAELADGEILAFTDSDCVLAPDAVGLCVAALVRHPELGAVSGHARAANANQSTLTRVQDVWYEGQFRVAKAAEAAFGSVTCVSGPLAVFRREAIVNYLPAWAGDRFLGGEFRFATDRQLTGYVLGQAWLGEAAKRRYADSPFVRNENHPVRVWRVGYVHSAKVWTTVPARMRTLLRQQVRWKKSFIRNVCFNGRFMWRRGPVPAALYYGHVLWVMVAPLMAVRHLVLAPVRGEWWLVLLYVSGVLLKGAVWGLAVKLDEPGSTRWRYRPLMSLFASVVLAWLLPYALATIRRGIWSRGNS